MDVEAGHQCDLIPFSQVYAICLGVNEQNPRKGINGTNWLCWKKRCLHGAFFYYLPYLSWTMAIYSIWFRDRSKAIDCKIWRFARIWRLVPRNFLTLETDSQVLTQEFSSEKCRCRNTMLKSSEKLRQAFGPEGDQWLCGKQWEETWQHTFSTNLAGSCHASNVLPQEIVSHTYISQSRGANPVQGASIVCHLKKKLVPIYSFVLHLFFTNRISICISLSLANCFWR